MTSIFSFNLSRDEIIY